MKAGMISKEDLTNNSFKLACQFLNYPNKSTKTTTMFTAYYSKPHCIWCAMILSFALLTTSCAKTIQFQSSQVVPAARGSVKYKKDKNNNYLINIHLVNLAESNRLTPPRKVYVVWMETQDDRTKNIGQIISGSTFMSKKLKASFETSSVFKPRRIFISAEDEATTSYPNLPLILSTGNFWHYVQHPRIN